MRAWLALLLMLPLAAAAQTSGREEDSGHARVQAEAKVSLPAFPKPENYLPFEVNSLTPFSFFVDAKSIGVGADGVVRYTLIAKSAEGALNVSFEGMRCGTHEYRVYAFGRPDKTWYQARESRWRPISIESRNLQRDVLYDKFFCAFNGYVTSAEEGIRALKRGVNPKAILQGD